MWTITYINEDSEVKVYILIEKCTTTPIEKCTKRRVSKGIKEIRINRQQALNFEFL